MDATALCEGSAQSKLAQATFECLFEDISLCQCENQRTFINVVSLGKMSIFFPRPRSVATRQLNGARETHDGSSSDRPCCPFGRPCVPAQIGKALAMPSLCCTCKIFCARWTVSPFKQLVAGPSAVFHDCTTKIFGTSTNRSRWRASARDMTNTEIAWLLGGLHKPDGGFEETPNCGVRGWSAHINNISEEGGDPNGGGPMGEEPLELGPQSHKKTHLLSPSLLPREESAPSRTNHSDSDTTTHTHPLIHLLQTQTRRPPNRRSNPTLAIRLWPSS